MEPMKDNKMGTMPVGKLLVNMALPMIISMLVQALYNTVDSIYVSQVSESAVTALGLAFPVQNLQIGFGVGIGVGVNALLSQSLGRKDQESANWAAGNGVFLTLIATALFMLFGIFGVRPYYEMQSSVAETVEGGIAYTSICCIFTAGVFVQILCERLLQATGRAFQTMILQGTGAIINIILDPVFIHGWWGVPKMGIAGAAVATVLGQTVGAVLGIYMNLRHNPEIHLHVRYMRPRWQTIRPVLEVGIPSVIMNGIGSVMNFGINQILQGFHETATGVFGIYFKLQSLFCMPLFGINNATISIMAYNYGARKPKRITGTLKLATAVGVVIMVLGMLAFLCIPQVLLSLFNPTEAFLSIGTRALRILGLPFPLAAICICLSASFQALGKGSYSTIVSLSRQLLVLLPVAYLLSLTGNVDNVWWAFPIAELASLTATCLLFGKLYQTRIKPLMGEGNV